MNVLGLSSSVLIHIEHGIENYSFYTVSESSVSTGFAKQIMVILRIVT
jgi:hypothetical protein